MFDRHDCPLGLEGLDPSLVELYLSETIQMAVFRMDSPFDYYDTGQGTLTATGKSATNRLDRQAERGPIFLTCALSLMPYQIIRAGDWAVIGHPIGEWEDIAKDYENHHKDFLGNIVVFAYDQRRSLERGEPSHVQHVHKRMNCDFRFFPTREAWIAKVKKFLSHKTRQGDLTLNQLENMITAYLTQRKKDSLPFIWHAGKPVPIALRPAPKDESLTSTPLEDSEYTDLRLRVKLPETKRGEGTLILTATIIDGSGNEKTAKTLTRAAAIPPAKQGKIRSFEGLFLDADNQASQTTRVMRDLYMELDSEIERIISNEVLRKKGINVH